MLLESQGINKSFLNQTQNIGGLLVMDVGPRGGGKTTKAVEVIQLYKETEPEVRRISNVPIEGAYYKPEILKFLATKLIAEGGEKPYEIAPDGTIRIVPRKTKIAKMLVIVDETAISGLEARGSGTASPLPTYLLALSRKINVDCELITQLMSMSDKRAPWLSDFFTLCESFPDYGYFRYRNFDSNYQRTSTQRIYFDFAREYLFPKFDTTDIPNYDELSAALKISYQISEDDMQAYFDIRDGKKHISPQNVTSKARDMWIFSKKSLRAPMGRYPGETVITPENIDAGISQENPNLRWEVLQKDWSFEHSSYRYHLREIPEFFEHQQSIEEGGLEPMEETQ